MTNDERLDRIAEEDEARARSLMSDEERAAADEAAYEHEARMAPYRLYAMGDITLEEFTRRIGR